MKSNNILFKIIGADTSYNKEEPEESLPYIFNSPLLAKYVDLKEIGNPITGVKFDEIFEVFSQYKDLDSFNILIDAHSTEMDNDKKSYAILLNKIPIPFEQMKYNILASIKHNNPQKTEDEIQRILNEAEIFYHHNPYI